MSNGARAPSSPRTRRSYAKVGETRGGAWLAPSPFAPSRSSSQGGPHPFGRCPSPATLQSSATASGREREVLLIGGSGSRPRWGGVQESEAMRRGRAMCTLEKLQAWLDVGPFGNSSREEETMQSGWGRGGGCPVLFYSKTGGASEQRRGLTQGCRERSSLAAKNAVGTPAGGRLVVHLGNESRTGFQAGICNSGSAMDHALLFIRRQYAGPTV